VTASAHQDFNRADQRSSVQGALSQPLHNHSGNSWLGNRARCFTSRGSV